MADKNLSGNILLDASSFPGAVPNPSILLVFKAPVGETLYQFKADRDYRVVWCHTATATSYVAKIRFTSTQDTATGFFQDVCRLTVNSIVFYLDWQLKTGEILFIDVAGSSEVKVSLRPV